MRRGRLDDGRLRNQKPRRGQLLIALTAVLTVVAGGLAVPMAARADAVSDIAAHFDAADIISDEVMFNPGTMSAAQIQTFLDGMVPTCRTGYTCLKSYRQTTTTRTADPMCGQYTGAANESAATIIARVGAACGVNPQALIVTLQKEQGLVTDSWPSSGQFRIATGYGCPDTAACDSTYYGFFNQVYMAAWAFKRYTSPPGTSAFFSWYPVGRPSQVQYSPSGSCGSKTVVIKNKATASLYYYTPYTPNAAALAAGFGTASCGAYGNRNFFLYFTEWFGSTHYIATGAIGDLVHALSTTAQKALGNPTANQVAVTAGGGGLAQTFAHGTVYSSSAGTRLVSGAVLSEYVQRGGPGGALGWPAGGVATSRSHGGGTVQSFQHGKVFSSPAGVYSVTGALRTAYHAAGYQRGTLGWPTSDATVSAANGGGLSQRFQGGQVLQPTGGGAHLVTGAFLTQYLGRDGSQGSLGWPVGDAVAVKAHGGGSMQAFQAGGLYASKAGRFAVLGAIGTEFAAHGGVTGGLGWPVATARHVSAHGGGSGQRFTGGTIYWSSAGGAHLVSGAVLTEYLRRGGPAGSLGWPTARGVHIAGHGGSAQAFRSGQIFKSRHGTVTVRGTVLTAYLAAGGPAGRLGWPTGSAHVVKGVTVQVFQHGSIRWTTARGAGITAAR